MKNILTIDDDQDTLNFLSKILSKDYQVTSSLSAQESLTSLQASTPEALPDLIIVDIQMPVMDGIEFRSRMDKITPLAKIPVVFLTANNKLFSKVEPKDQTFFLNKPIHKDDLLTMVDSFFYKTPNVTRQL